MILGEPSPLPLFLSAVAMCGMGHTDGELVRGEGLDPLPSGVCLTKRATFRA